MCDQDIEVFRREREGLNETVTNRAGNIAKRLYSLDNQGYREGALSVKQKELMGLVASLVLRCDDCIPYHLDRCHEEGVSDLELAEALDVGALVGGTITIPHLRRAFETWDELKRETGREPPGKEAD